MQLAISQTIATLETATAGPLEPLPVPRDSATVPSLRNCVPPLMAVMDLIQSVAAERDPFAALGERLSRMQSLQQARFAQLPSQLKEDDEVLLRHQWQLVVNQACHDAARGVLRLAKAWSRLR